LLLPLLLRPISLILPPPLLILRSQRRAMAGKLLQLPLALLLPLQPPRHTIQHLLHALFRHNFKLHVHVADEG
jgi:hypothetical protein